VSTVKALRFRASVGWRGDRLTHVAAPGKPTLEVVTPPEFRGGVPGKWSPEDLLVAATASCFALTFTAIATRLGLDIQALEVDGLGHVEKDEDGRYRFVAIELVVELEGDEEAMSAAQNLIAETERRCIVGLALDVPVHARMVHAEHARAPASI
jgi:organic hydroperoxide reductase OsmC/OhrA